MKFILKLIFIAFCVKSYGQELQPIKQILERGIRNNDNAQIAYVLKRCVSLNLVMGNWMEAKGGESLKKATENFFHQALVQKQLSFEIENSIEKDRNIKLSTKAELEETLLVNIKAMSPLYIARLAKNYTTSGSYFENDLQLSDEISICADISKFIKTIK